MGEGQAVGAEARETGLVVGFFVVLHDAGDVEAEDEQAAVFAIDGDGELFDEAGFGTADGAEIGDVVVEHLLEIGGVVDVGEERVEVDGLDFGFGAGLAGGGFGAAGLGTVAAGGVFLRGNACALGPGLGIGGRWDFVSRQDTALSKRSRPRILLAVVVSS
jgi:hypothetical protein